jgi:Mrp family chromosome partitioning ATPase
VSEARPLRELARSRLAGRKVIAVMSTKGGVGKSVVASLIALSLPSSTVIDLDLHGMAIPKLFGLDGKMHEVGKDGIEPFKVNNVELVSLSGVVGNKYVILPGRNAASVMEELIAYSKIGSKYVVVDMPPGLGDEVLVLEEVADFVPVVVTTPSKVSQKVVDYVVGYLRDRGKRPYLVVNMAYVRCGDQVLRLWGEAEGDLELPIDPSLESYVGKIQDYEGELRDKVGEFVRKNLL